MSGGAAAGETWDELARLAARPDGVAEPEVPRQLLVFTVDGTAYAAPVESVREIVRMRPITPIPRVESDIRGVISLRGEIIQVVDLRRRLGMAPAAPSRSSRIVVLQAGDDLVAGLLVDGVREVIRVAEADIVPPLEEGAGVQALCRRGDAFVSLHALDHVLGFDRGV